MTRPSSRACLATVGLTAALATAVRAQDQPSPPVFEVAAIKPHNPSDAGGGFRFQHGRLTISNTELKVLVMSAYGVNQFQISGGPNWMDSERFDILAQAPGGSDHRHLSPMLQALLADRFKLALHRETRETTVYALALAKDGPKLQRSAPDAQYSIEMGPAGMSATKMSIHHFVDTLSGYTRRRVIDKTGLKGDFDWKFDWSPGPQ